MHRKHPQNYQYKTTLQPHPVRRELRLDAQMRKLRAKIVARNSFSNALDNRRKINVNVTKSASSGAIIGDPSNIMPNNFVPGTIRLSFESSDMFKINPEYNNNSITPMLPKVKGLDIEVKNEFPKEDEFTGIVRRNEYLTNTV